MCKGGGSSSSTIDPRIMQMLQQNYASAQSVANRPYQPYTGQLTAGLTPSQQQAGSLLQSAPFMGQDAFNTGINAAAQGTQYQTPQVSSGFYNPAMAEAGMAGPPALMNAAATPGFTPAQAALVNPVSGAAAQAGPAALANAAQIDANALPFLPAPSGLAQLSGYINPYTQNVVDAAMNELNRQNQIALNGVNQNAAAENAFGGDRQAVAQALTNDDYARAKANVIANLDSQGFNNAAGLLQNNQQMGLQAGSNNLNAALQAAGQNAGYIQGANLANASALNNMGEFNLSNLLQNNQFNAGMQQQANQANAGAENQVNLFNAGNQQAVNLANAGAQNTASQFDLNNFLQLQLANQSAANAAQGLDLQGAGLLGNLGAAQNSNYLNGVNVLNGWGAQAQQTEQNVLNAAYQQYLNQFNYPVQMQQLLNSALSGGMGAGSTNPVAAGQATGGLLGGLGSLGSAAAMLLPLL